MEKIEEIRKLKALLDQGAINEEEFNSIKSELISKETDTRTSKVSQTTSSLNKGDDMKNKTAAVSRTIEKPPVKTKSAKFEDGNATTVSLFKVILGLSVILGIVFWIRYDSFIAFIIATVISIGLAMAVARLFVPKLKPRNITLGILSAFLLLLIIFPIGAVNKSSSSSPSSSYSTDDIPCLHCKFCKKVVYGNPHEDITCYTIEPDGIGMVFFNSGTKYAFCSEQCAILYRSIE